MWSDLDRAWFAGFFEGEGSVDGTAKNGKRYYKIGIAQVNPEPLLRVQDIAGGSIRLQRRSQTNPRHSDVYHWQASGETARAAVREILPLMSEKRRKQMQPVIAFKPAPPKSHCGKGHEFTPENTYTYPDGMRRQCKTCLRAWGRKTDAARSPRARA